MALVLYTQSSSQMAASDQILSSILSDPPPSPSPVTYQWLLPNTKGLRTFLQTVETARPASPSNDAGTSSPPPRLESGPALNTSSYDPNAMPSAESGVDGTSHSRSPEGASLSKNGHRHEVSVFMAATESFNRANTNCSVQESLDRFKPVFSDSKEAGFAVRAYISVALGCPFEGPRVDPHKVADIAASLMEMGADEVSVADTTGMGTAPSTKKLLQTLQEAGIRSEDTAMHFHDTYGQALTNTMVALDHGIRAFDSAVGGLGGCPFAPGATGNVATEDLVYSLHSLGAKTDVHLEELSRTGDWITSRIGKQNSSRAGRATLASLRREGKA